MRYLFSFKKKDVLGLLLLCAIAVSSCTNEDEVLKSNEVEPGIYTIEMTIDAQNAKTRGVDNGDFDENYEEDYIYLHCGENSLRIPVYAYCEDCEVGFRYVIEVTDDGSAILTPIDEDGELMESSLTIPQDGECYFSSWETCNWVLSEDQITERTTNEGEYIFYHRKKDINKEIYRSASDYKIEDLASNGDLVMNRACAGFDLVALFYEAADEAGSSSSDGPIYTDLTAEEFRTIMGDDYTNWYVKIYIGGSGFTYNYDLRSNASAVQTSGGYYASEDSTTFISNGYDPHQYLQFESRWYGRGSTYHNGLGYYTKSGNHLFTPVTGGEVNVYVLIKHWTGNGDPSEDWLLDDTGALYTKVDLSSTSTPVNGSYYTYGLLMDIRQFKSAWDAAGGDTESLSNAVTRGLGLEASREFFLKDAKVICESY